MHYDPDSGQLLSGSFLDYCMPRADDVPSFVTEMHEVPCRSNPIGVKGCGEGGTVGATPAVISGILDALAPYGVTDIALPATPERVWRAIAGARAG
jgi:carbon-monoxide dehydrogenase large subunit